MKPPRFLFFMLFISIIAASGCANGVSRDDPWFGADKFEHALISAGMAASSTMVAKRADMSKPSAPIIGFSASFAVGIGKEAYDLRVRKTFWSWKDLCWDVLGSAIGSAAASR